MNASKSYRVKPSDKKQAQISSFFQQKPSTNIKSSGLKTTPERVLASRSSSFLSRTNSTLNSSKDAFEEVPSSDISFDSPEINNFKNSNLARSLSTIKDGKASDSSVIDLTQDEENIPEPRSSPLAKTAPRRTTNPVPSNNVSLVSVRTEGGTAGAGVSMKRSHSALMDHLNGIPRKVPRQISRVSTTSFNSNSSSFLDFSNSPIKLSDEQKQVITYIVQDGLNVFYTGSAGTGKSVVLRELVTRLNSKFYSSNVGVTASTGLAACNIGGQTIHRFLGIGFGEGSVDSIVASIKKKPAVLKRWKTLKVLIIDEISMIQGRLFEKLNNIGKVLRNSPNLPFGGIQIVCTGDFFQLPPVVKGGPSEFCFEMDSWRETIQKTILLSEIFRQKGDTELIDMLNSLRFGNLNDQMIAKFSKLTRKIKYEDGLEPTELFPLREDVKRANDYRLQQLPLSPIKYLAMDTSKDPFHQKMLENLMCERELTLKVGAQVMYLKNLDDDIVNGSIGTVLYFLTTPLWDKVSAIYGDDSIGLDEQVNDEIRLISSKVESQLTTWDNPEDVALYEKIPLDRRSRFQQLVAFAMNEKQMNLYPVIRFNIPRKEPKVILVQREEFRIDSARVSGVGGGEDNRLCRVQLPLLLSWALSIHKAQGQTISRLRIDLKKVFEKGQVYVALSRATSKELLEIVNFDPRKIQVADKVKQFYDKLDKGYFK